MTCFISALDRMEARIVAIRTENWRSIPDAMRMKWEDGTKARRITRVTEKSSTLTRRWIVNSRLRKDSDRSLATRFLRICRIR